DGCVVARSPEVKAIGIPMGAPAFKIRHQIERHDIKVFSSNYALYGDMSHRVMTALAEFAPEVEVYSIDEAFLNLSGMGDRDVVGHVLEMREKVLRWTGIPVSLGLARTKVLTKIATRVAKRCPQWQGVFNLSNSPDADDILAGTDVSDVWGIGRRYAAWLRDHNITTALHLRDAREGLVRKKMGVVGARLQMELRGVSCLPLELYPSPKKETCVSRSFGQVVTSLEELKEAIALRTTRLGEKLRSQRQSATLLQVFARTSAFDEKPYSNAATLTLPMATNYTPELLRHALRGTEAIFEKGYRYKKAGVIAMGLLPESIEQGHLFEPPRDRQRDRELMSVVDSLNRRFGSGTVGFAASGVARPWQMRCERRSRRFTTRWDELPLARAD
ncbi:MAG: Y-family DNA polymerase, partial [Cyanobacteria bacterium J06648_11]